MCVSCGCGKVNEDHGDERNITMDKLEDAAEAAGKSVGEVTKNIGAASAGSDGASDSGAQERGEMQPTGQQR